MTNEERKSFKQYKIKQKLIKDLYEAIKRQEWSKELKSLDSNGTCISVFTKNARLEDTEAISISYTHLLQ